MYGIIFERVRSEDRATVGRWTVANGTCHGWMGAGEGRAGKSFRFMVLISSGGFVSRELLDGAGELTDRNHAFAVVV